MSTIIIYQKILFILCIHLFEIQVIQGNEFEFGYLVCNAKSAVGSNFIKKMYEKFPTERMSNCDRLWD